MNDHSEAGLNEFQTYKLCCGQDKLPLLRPVLFEKEVSKEHLEVLRLIMEIIELALPRANAPSVDLELDLCSAFLTGALKLSDPKRFVSVDDICRSVRCFAIVVQVCDILFSARPNDRSFIAVHTPKIDHLIWCIAWRLIVLYVTTIGGILKDCS